ncbi:unnamed protein product [Dracunculus medinensis]|uniref:FMRFamide-related neuropeptide n=1 Tax=Dracunculus medinensis TaxID=318479 RepID=A0A0N4UIK6_DRAME|nr:unnamed protein product [Dracunculus medinensis]
MFDTLTESVVHTISALIMSKRMMDAYERDARAPKAKFIRFGRNNNMKFIRFGRSFNDRESDEDGLAGKNKFDQRMFQR